MAKFKSENFKVLNKDNTAVVYRTPDKNYNKLTFSITNKSASNIEFKAGAQPSEFSFNISFISDNRDAISQLKITPPDGWEAVPVTVKTWVEWKLTCLRDAQLAPNASLSIIIENVLCEKEKPGYFIVSSRGIPGYDDSGSLPPTVFLSVLRPPIDPAKANPVPFTAGYTNVVHPIANQIIHPNKKMFTENEAIPVYITYDGNALIKNGFKLILTNNDEKPIVLNTVSESDRPVVTISFLFGREDNDITTQDLGDRQITIGVASDKWTPIMHTDDSPSWQFYPQLPQQIDSHKTVGFIVENIVTPVNVPDEKISLMYVQVNKFANFDDRVFIFQINKKKAKAAMKPLSADNTRIKIGDDVKLTWSSSLAKRVTITYNDRDGNPIQLDTAATDPNKKIELDANNYKLLIKPTAETTQFEAVAYDTIASPDTQKAVVEVEQRAAEIKWFKVTPQLLAKDTKTTVTFSWEVEDAVQLILVTKSGNIDVSRTTSKTIEVDSAFEHTLRAYAYGTRLKEPREKKLRTFTYKNEPSVPLPLPANQKQNRQVIALNPNTQFKRFYVSNKATNTIYEISTDDGSIVKTYPGNIFALIPDGTKLAVLNSLPKAPFVTLYDIRSGATSGAKPIFYSRAGEQMRFLPDGSKLFVSCTYVVGDTELADDVIVPNDQTGEDLGATSAYTFSFKVDAANTRLIPVDGFTSTGSGIESIAVNKEASMLYYSSYNHKVVFLTYDNGKQATRNIDVPYTKGILLKENWNANKIYAAFEDSNSVIVIDTIGNYGCATIPVGEYPADMVLSPDSSKLYVACIKTNKVAVVDTATNQVIKTYEGIDTPSALTLSQNGEVLFVANYCAKTISMIDLKLGDFISNTLSTGTASGNPFGIVAVDTAKGSKVFVAKESYPDRITCTATSNNTSLDVTVLTIEKP